MSISTLKRRRRWADWHRTRRYWNCARAENDNAEKWHKLSTRNGHVRFIHSSIRSWRAEHGKQLMIVRCRCDESTGRIAISSQLEVNGARWYVSRDALLCLRYARRTQLCSTVCGVAASDACSPALLRASHERQPLATLLSIQHHGHTSSDMPYLHFSGGVISAKPWGRGRLDRRPFLFNLEPSATAWRYWYSVVCSRQ